MAKCGKIVAVCLSEKKGTRKSPTDFVSLVTNFGVEGDSHAAFNTTRQVSFLAMEKIIEARNQGYNLGPGDFAENITTEGLDLCAVSVGERLAIGENGVELLITQKGKECHDDCDVKEYIGFCIARKNAIFAKVVRGGQVQKGDIIKVLSKE